MSALALGATAACLWGVSGFIGGLAARRTSALLVATGAQAVGLVLVLAALVAVRPAAPSVAALAPALLGGLAGGVGLVALFRALALGPMGLVAPVAATGVAVPIVAGLATGERPTALQGFGVVVAVSGVVVASHRPSRATASGARRRASAAPLLLAATAAACFGAFYLGLDAGGDDDVLWTVAAARILSVAFLMAWTAVVYTRSSTPLGAGSRSIAASGALDVAGNAVFTLATAQGLLVLAAVPASLYPVVTLVCARVALDERLAAQQRIGTSLALAGVACMAVPA